MSQTALVNERRDASSSTLLGMSWIHFLNDGSANFLPGILPAILALLGEPVKMVGIIMSTLLIGQALQPVMGIIADKIGGRKLLFAGLTSSTIGGALIAFAHNIWVLMILLLLIGIGTATFHPQALATVRGIAKQHHGLSLSVFMVGGELGRGIWPFLVSILVDRFGLGSLWVIALPFLISIPFIWRMVPPLPKKNISITPINWKEHMLPAILLVSYASVRSFATVGIITFFTTLWNLQGGSLVGGASILTTFLVVGVIGNLGGGHIADRFGRRVVLITGGIFATFLIPLLLYANGLILWILAGILGIMVYSSSPVTILIGQDIFPENRSLGSGFAAGFPGGIAALMIFLISSHVTESNLPNVFWILAGAAFIATIFAAIIPKKYMIQHEMEQNA